MSMCIHPLIEVEVFNDQCRSFNICSMMDTLFINSCIHYTCYCNYFLSYHCIFPVPLLCVKFRLEVILQPTVLCLHTCIACQLYCKNGQPYRLTERDTYRCEVVIGSSPICCVTDTTWNHKIIVSFNSTLAGVYKVTAHVNRLLIGDRTYIHEYRPGNQCMHTCIIHVYCCQAITNRT